MPSLSRTPDVKRLRERRRHLRALRQRAAFWLGALLVGLAALAFTWLADHAYERFTWLLERYPYAPWLITPTGFALLAWLTQGYLKEAQGSGIPQVIASLEQPSTALRQRLLSIPVALAKMLLTVLALLCGASVGREGPTVHIGAALMYNFGRRLGLETRHALSGLILAGGAAGIAAAFNTPLAGVAFALEELSTRMEQSFNGVILMAVLIGGLVTLGLMGHYSYFGEISAELPLSDAWLAVLVCGVFGGLLGGLYARLVLPAKRGPLAVLGAWRNKRPVIFAAVCGLLLALLGLISGQHVFGTGYAETQALLEGQPEAGGLFVLWKFLANVVSYLAGIPGGLFSPSLAVGAGIAPWLTEWIPGLTLQTAGLLGMAAYLAGVTRTPLTATVITIELAHSQDMALPILAASLLASSISARISPVPLYRAFAQNLLDQLAPKPEAQKHPEPGKPSA